MEKNTSSNTLLKRGLFWFIIFILPFVYLLRDDPYAGVLAPLFMILFLFFNFVSTAVFLRRNSHIEKKIQLLVWYGFLFPLILSLLIPALGFLRYIKT